CMPGYLAGSIQSPCSKQRMFMRVSARLQAKAAPDAPAPMIRTSTTSSDIILLPADVRTARRARASSRRGQRAPRAGARASREPHFDAVVVLHLDHHRQQVTYVDVVQANRAEVLDHGRRQLHGRIALGLEGLGARDDRIQRLAFVHLDAEMITR